MIEVTVRVPARVLAGYDGDVSRGIYEKETRPCDAGSSRAGDTIRVGSRR